jgi:zinc finger SWIM domain-containing protein 3
MFHILGLYFNYCRIVLQMANNYGEPVIVPEVGISFKSEDDAFGMYNSYARSVSFSIRKSTTRQRPDKTIYQKHIVYSNQGQRGKHSSYETLKQNSTTWTCCDARVQFRISREGIWTMQKVILDHNHGLVSPNKAHKLRSQRHIIEADRQLIARIREDGIKPPQVYEFFKKWYGRAENVPFSWMDCNNLIGCERKKYLPTNDAQTLFEYLKNKQVEDPTFFMPYK